MKRRTFISTTLLALVGGRHAVQAAGGCVVKGAPSVLPPLDSTPLRANQLYVIGDWGARSKIQREVAETMGTLAARDGSPLRIVSVGDNIYPDGVESAHDPLWASTFENVYTQPAIQVPWVAVLGNHDYRKSTQAQIDYGKRNDRWIMPERYFSHTITGSNGVSVALTCLDTQMLLQKKAGWKEQLAWAEKTLADQKSETWRLVVGHHPMRSYGHYGDQQWMLNLVKPIMEQQGADVYLAGHDHDLQIIDHPEDEFVSVVTGAGGGCRSTHWGEHSAAAATGGGYVRLDMDEKALRMTIITSRGGIIGSHTVTKRTL